VSSPGSVTVWLTQLRAGQADAAQHLWEGYFRRLVGLARQKLLGRPRAAADEEDVALSAFNSFCRGVDQDRFPRLADRDDLWHLLVLLAAPVHNRMPVILPVHAYEPWLDPANQDVASLQGLLQPYPAETLFARTVSTFVKSEE
jgi:hypothetical protein